ncbi:MAG: translation initiation factor 2 [Oscillospiraceae bacterium]|nr:translation initiation factor 2 [Oscillospiraceae bacterium]
MEELIDRIAATAQSDLKLPDEQLPTIRRYVKRAVNRIKVFCFRKDFPEPLEDVAAQIVEDMLKADQIAPTENDVSGITRGDTRIDYRDKTSALKETVAFVKNYESQLIPFKRMKLPRDCPDD